MFFEYERMQLVGKKQQKVCRSSLRIVERNEKAWMKQIMVKNKKSWFVQVWMLCKEWKCTYTRINN